MPLDGWKCAYAIVYIQYLRVYYAKIVIYFRVSKDSVSDVYKLLNLFKNIEVEYEGNIYSSNIILKNIALIYFNSDDENLNA